MRRFVKLLFLVDLRRQSDPPADPGHRQGRFFGHQTVGRIVEATRRHAQEDIVLADVLLRLDAVRKNHQQILERHGRT